MKKLTKLLLLIFFTNTFAQNAKIDWFKNKIDPKIEILGMVNNQIIGIIKEQNTVFYVKIGTNGEVSKKEKLPFKFDNQKYSYVNTILTKNSVLVIIRENRLENNIKEEKEKQKKIEEEIKKGTNEEKNNQDIANAKKSLIAKQKNKENLKKFNDSLKEERYNKILIKKEEKIKVEKEFILAINIGTELNVNNKPVKIKSVTIKENMKKYGMYSFSNDSTKILIYNQLNTSITEQIRYSFTIIDEKLTKKEKDTIFEIPMLMVNPEKTKINKLYLDNSNNILGVFKEIKEIEDNNSNFFYKILMFDNISFKPRKFEIDYNESIIDNLEIFPQNNNKFICVGFLAGIQKGIKFSRKASVKKNEVFLAEINSQEKTYNKIFNTNIDVLYPYNQLKITNYIPYKVEDVYISNNEYTIIAHQVGRKSIKRNLDPGEELNLNDNNIFYGDISILKVSKKGILNYSGNISKYQSSSNKNSYLLHTYRNNKLYAIYEDNILNKDVDYEIDPWSTIRSNETKNLDKSLFLASVDQNKKVVKEPIYDYSKNSNRAILKKSIKINNNTFFLIGNNSIGKLTLN